MKREIKFRAWDKDDRAFLMPEFADGMSITLKGDVGHHENIDEDDYGVIQNGKAYFPEEKFITEIYELDQCIGLKDKNGKDIYHNDFIKDQWGNISLITWNENNACFKATKTHMTKGDMQISEVIGNIYENPELLKTDI